ncbi:tyrosine-protein phosphatase [Pedobacter puniceum]|uniref:protein-tyrosine-phosphatase n=1 Tax=Pedobacter puniceum TaxID=2666136 RepID=A0A7K0FQ11_9SPHI|nr:CpsB/CapC family capsule biosynthesis tyrosine phosphatase [Pedobacter puniceum]MRX47963.1 capsular biosynthesis protein [Pedobacter puniceum]
MFSFFKKKKEAKYNFNRIQVDMHSHILPGIDDGAPTVKESIMLVRRLMDLGFTKLIATPHIMADYYRNTPDTIRKALDELKEELEKENIQIPVEAAAEYYLDETFERKLDAGNLLTLGDNYLLFELSYINYPNNLKDVIQKMNDKGYKPILAHPERYPYLYASLESYQQVKEYGCYFQLNTISLSNHYGKQAQKVAENLVENMMIDFLGSDMHHLRHADSLQKSLFTPTVEQLLSDDYSLYNELLK